MQFIKPDINIDFIGKRRIAFLLSVVFILVSFGSLIVKKGPRYGVDFAGGTLIQVRFQSPAEINTVKSGLASMGMKGSSVQAFGDANDNEYLIRTDNSLTTGEDFTDRLKTTLSSTAGSEVEIRRLEMVIAVLRSPSLPHPEPIAYLTIGATKVAISYVLILLRMLNHPPSHGLSTI